MSKEDITYNTWEYHDGYDLQFYEWYGKDWRFELVIDLEDKTLCTVKFERDGNDPIHEQLDQEFASVMVPATKMMRYDEEYEENVDRKKEYFSSTNFTWPASVKINKEE